VKKYADR